MDRLDREILGILQEDARISYRDLGVRVGLSANAAGDRVRRMRRDGVIRGFTVIVDPAGAMVGLLAAAGLNVVVAASTATVLWAVLGPALLGVVTGIVFPLLQLAMLDLFQERRGAAASMASFASLVFNAALAGAIVPLVSSTLLVAATASAVMAATRSASSRAAAAGTTIRAITRTVPTASTAATTTSAMSRFRTRSRTPVR